MRRKPGTSVGVATLANMIPAWLTVLSWFAIVAGVLSAAWIGVDVLRHPQKMTIMSVVWPIVGLFGPGLMVWAYFAWGRPDAKDAQMGQMARHEGHGMHHSKPPFPIAVAKGALHCGSGCTLGDLCAESLLIFFPFTWFGSELLTGWTLDYIAAFVLGIAFQYFSIKPMTGQSPGQALVSALKADSLSLTAWQVGMYGWMAIVTFLIFGHPLEKTSPVFWFMMQLAMLLGFLVAYPVNAWLLRRGIKERM